MSSNHNALPEEAKTAPEGLNRTVLWMRRLVPIVLLAVVGWLLAREIGGLDIHQLRSQLRDLDIAQLVGLCGLGISAVSAMYLYDWTVARWLNIHIPWQRLLRYSWIANTFNNLAGMSGLTGSGIRYLLLTREGIGGAKAASYSGTMVLSVPLGLSTLIALTLPLAPSLIHQMPAASGIVYAVVALFALYLPVFFLLTGSGRLHQRFLRALPPLSLRYRLGLVGISVLDWLFAAITLWLCLRVSGVQIPLPLFVAGFVLSAALGIASLLPGGLGVFDGALLLTLSSSANHADTLAGILLFRLFYYLIPWLIAVYLGAELLTVRSPTLRNRLASRLQRYPLLGILQLPVSWLASFGVRVLAWMTFAAGLVLLLSSASPSIAERTALLHDYLPVPAIEGSHFVSVAIGVLLVGLARGIAGQVRSAYRLTQVLLLSGAVFSLIKGIDYEEALFLLMVAVLLRGRQRFFYRETYALFSRRNVNWFIGFILALALFMAVGDLLTTDSHLMHLLAHWGYGVMHPTRFLQSVLVMAITVLGFLGWSWFRMPGPPLHKPKAEELEQTRRFFERNGSNNFSHLAFMGDKHLFYGAEEKVLIQFGAIRNVFVALGDPVGPDALIDQAIREFREFADRHDRVPVFYEVDEDRLHHYHDCGFRLFKLGEEALVPLTDFTLSGKRKGDLRAAVNRAEREGLTFDILEHPLPESLWQQLQQISDAWLQERQGAEKGFSLGAFTRDYLEASPIAVVRRQDDIIAFANLMPGYGQKYEFSVDLMRHVPDAPGGTMDFLFVRLMEYGRDQGYTYFNLGMAPLAGVGDTPYAFRSERLASLAYKYGNRLYNYKGLRRYKDKFSPEWRGAYLAYPHGRNVQTLLLDIAALVAGGYMRVLLKK
ncbi:bifunctional lysylphosphatidylglycerol flippase/synthetase MprF [Mangrovitalea sediminis]|uniref:bifunctional lysylphosphatidylglycerol flippase/synthetase MprF n=1 Tax=Mangrovitalea sediminis TaxID=1982043 RepID=UPI000BE5DAA5|nr:bifunctional lysylphosphatidylglycerol flippase/synthetase MprF [Mangrovitalea sediminis]